MDSQRMAQVTACIDQLQRELAVAAAERDRQVERAAALSRELLRSEAAQADVEELRARTAELEVDLDRTQDELDSANNQIRNLTREMEAMRATLSWRATWPLRMFRRHRRSRTSR